MLKLFGPGCMADSDTVVSNMSRENGYKNKY